MSSGSPEAPRTMIELLRRRAEERPAQRLFTFLPDGAEDGPWLSYAELDRRARAVAALLQQHGGAGQRALLLYPPGLEFTVAFFGCLYAGVIAVPAYPPVRSQSARTLPRLRAIAGDAGATIALTTAEVRSMAGELTTLEPGLSTLSWLATDLPHGTESAWRDVGGGEVAFLQYTSGSTAAPKGVVLTHRNLLENTETIRRLFQQNQQSVGVCWLPLHHDMGLIGHVIHTIYVGMTLYLMPPMAFLKRPLRWLQAISRVRATISGAPNFAYDLAAQRVTDEQRAGLDLSSWSLAFNGSEPVHYQTLRRFADKFAPAGFRWEAFSPCYGLAEATLQVAGSPQAVPPVVVTVDIAELERHEVVERASGDARGRTLVGCGRPLESVAIVDPTSGARCAADRVGEIWVRGPQVALGYWNQAELTARTFNARLDGEGPFLRTGDLGFVHDGELFVTGRIKDLIIVGGRNHYPQDLELTAEQCHPGLRPGGVAAFSITLGESEAAVVLAEGAATGDGPAIVRAIRRAVVEAHELHVHTVKLVPRGSLPKTSSGKLQRQACRAAFLAHGFDAK